MAAVYESMTDDAVGILEKALKSKPKDTKARTDLHKKANAKLKELQKHLADSVVEFTKSLDTTTRTLEEAVGVASSEAKLLDREIVRHLKHAIKLSKAIDRPKGWTDDFDKAAKTVSAWEPKAEGVKELEQGIKCLEAGKKCIKTNLAATNKQEVECNAFVDKAILDLDSLKDEELKKKVSPYLCRYVELFHAS
jgi:SOS response regulatory protein OraA/RecX